MNRRIIAFILMMIIPSITGLLMISSIEDMGPDRNYSFYLDLDITQTDDGAIIYWTDYVDGCSKITLQRIDAEGSKTGGRVSIDDPGHDLYSPKMAILNGMAYLVYMRTEEDVVKARTSEIQDSSVILQTFDPLTLGSGGDHPEGTTIGEFRSRTDRARINTGNNSFIVSYKLEWNGWKGVIDDSINTLRITGSGESPVIEKDPNIEEEKATVEIGSDGSIEWTLLERQDAINSNIPRNDHIRTDGQSFLVSSDDDESKEIFLMDEEGGILDSWSLNHTVTDYKEYVLDSEGIYLFWNDPTIAYLPFNDDPARIMELEMENDDTFLRGAVSDGNGHFTAGWNFEITVESGDDETTEDFVRFVQFDREMKSITHHDTKYGWLGARFGYQDDGDILGIGVVGGMDAEYRPFTVEDGDISLYREIAHFPSIGLGIFIIGFLLPFAVTVPSIFLMKKSMAFRNFSNMERSQLDAYSGAQLRKSLGKKYKKITKKKLIEILLQPREYDTSEEEISRLYSYLPVKFILFSVVLTIFPTVIIATSSMGSAHPAYSYGAGIPVQALGLTILLSAITVLLSKEWGTGPIRNYSLIGMAAIVLIGQISLVFISTMIINPLIFGGTAVFTIMNLVPGILVAGMGGTFLMIYERQGRKRILLPLYLFIHPLIYTFFTVIRTTSSIDIIPSPYFPAVSLSMLLGIIMTFLYLFVSMVCGMIMAESVRLNDIKPVNAWTRNDLDRIRWMNFIFTISVAIPASAGLIYGTTTEEMQIDDSTGVIMLTLIGIVVMAMGVGMWIAALLAMKKKESFKDISSSMMKVFFSPGLTLMGIFLLGMGIGIIGGIIGAAILLFQLFYSFFKLRGLSPENIEQEEEEKKEKTKNRKGNPPMRNEKIEKRNGLEKEKKPKVLEAPPKKGADGQVGRGELLYTEREESYRKRRTFAVMVAWIAILIGFFGMGYAVYSFLDPGICGMFFGFMALVFSIVAVILSIALLLGKGAKMRYEFYEGGLVDHSVYGGGEIFVPYGNLTGKKKMKKGSLGTVYVLTGPNRMSIWLWPGHDEAGGHLKTILKRVGKEEWKGEIQNATRDRMMTGFAPIMQAIVVVLGGLIAGPVIILMDLASLKIGLLMIPAVILIMNLIMSLNSNGLTRSFKDTMKKGKIDKTKRFRINMATTIFGLVVAIIMIPVVMLIPGSFMPDDIESERMPEDGITPDDLYMIAENNVDDIVIVEEDYTISDLDISFEAQTSVVLDIYVSSKGSLEAENVTFRSEKGNEMSIEIHGDAMFKDCNFIGLWGDPGTSNGDGGLEIHGGDVTFENCRFINGTTNLVMVADAKAKFINCEFSGADDDAIECQNSDVTLEDCTIRNCEWSVMCFDGSDVKIIDCEFEDVGEGVVVTWSSLKIEDCHFSDVTGTAVSSNFGGKVDEKGLTFENVGREVENDFGMDSIIGIFCSTTPLIVGIIALVATVYKMMKAKRKEEDK